MSPLVSSSNTFRPLIARPLGPNAPTRIAPIKDYSRETL
nr:hypothetical protein [uncultured bacterium]